MPFKGQALDYTGTPVHNATTTAITFTGKGIVHQLNCNLAGSTAVGNDASQKLEIVVDSVVIFTIQLGDVVTGANLANKPTRICNYLIGKTTAGTGMKAIVWALAEANNGSSINFSWKTFMPFTTSFVMRFVNGDGSQDMPANHVGVEFIAET